MQLPLFTLRRASVLLLAALLIGLPFSANSLAQEETEAEATDADAAGEQPEIDPEAAQKQGEEGLAEGDYDKAMTGFTQLRDWGLRNQYTQQSGPAAVLLGYTGRARTLAKMQDYEAALQEFKTVFDASADFGPARIARGEMYLEAGAPDRAFLDFQNAVKNDRNNMQALFGLGKASVLVGLYQQSITPLTRVIAAQEDNAEAYRLRGAAYANVYKTPLAYEDLQKSISIDPEGYEAYFTLGEVLFRDKKYEEAVEQFGNAIEHYKPKPGQEDQPYLQGHLTKAMAYVELGKNVEDPAAKKAAYQNAVEETEKLLSQLDENNPGHAVARSATLHSRGVGERMLGDIGRAIRTFSEAIEINPELSESYYRRGICFHHLGENKMAIADFVQAANMSLGDPRANLWEGFTYAKMGDYHQALRAYSDAIAASDRYTPAYVNRGLAYMMLGEYEKAVNDFNEAIRLEPAVAEHYFKRGVAYEQLRDYEKAAGSFASAIEFHDEHAGAYRHMASTMQSLGRTELANQYRQKANELAPAESQQQTQ